MARLTVVKDIVIEHRVEAASEFDMEFLYEQMTNVEREEMLEIIRANREDLFHEVDTLWSTPERIADQIKKEMSEDDIARIIERLKE